MANYSSLAAIQQQLQEGSLSCVQLVEHYLAEAKNKEHLNIFLEVFQETAMQKAKQVDEKLSAGKAGKLAGMVMAIKDNICYKGHSVSASSKILEGFESLYSATVVERLLAEDAIIIGRTNCDEFAMGSSNENSAHEPVKNPVNEQKVPGGSSGGSAAAVAAGVCLAALGSDTGGSVRQPASFCGVVGMKPTYGRVSRYGLLAYASSFDQIGPLTNNVEDAAAILQVIAGEDEYDSTLSSNKVPDLNTANAENKPPKIAYLKDYLERDGLDPEVKSSTESLIKQLKDEGHTVEPVEFPYLDYMVPVYYVLTTAEASSNLSRYDGIHYGYRSSKATDIDTTYIYSRSEGFGEEVQRRIMLGTFVLSAGYFDAYYKKGQKVRRIIQEKTNELFEEYDFIISPTTPHTAFNIGEKANDPIALYLEDIFTVQAPISGIPAISLPLFNHSNGLPFGLQVMAPHFKEAEMLQFSKQLMKFSPRATIEA